MLSTGPNEGGKQSSYHLPSLGALLDILHQLLLAVLQFRAFAVQFALRLCQGALVLPQALRRRHGAAKEGFLRIVIAEGSVVDE